MRDITGLGELTRDGGERTIGYLRGGEGGRVSALFRTGQLGNLINEFTPGVSFAGRLAGAAGRRGALGEVPRTVVWGEGQVRGSGMDGRQMGIGGLMKEDGLGHGTPYYDTPAHGATPGRGVNPTAPLEALGALGEEVKAGATAAVETVAAQKENIAGVAVAGIALIALVGIGAWMWKRGG